MKFEHQRLKFVIPLTMVVVISSLIMLKNRYPTLPVDQKLYILIGATIFTAVITYFLFPTKQTTAKDKGPY